MNTHTVAVVVLFKSSIFERMLKPSHPESILSNTPAGRLSISRLKMELHGVFKEVSKQCTNKDHHQGEKS
jgi:hypothetical protein